MSSIEEHKDLKERIAKAQDELEKIDPKHDLLELVNIDDIGIHWKEKFSIKYTGMTAYSGLSKYIDDLESAIKTKKKYQPE